MKLKVSDVLVCVAYVILFFGMLVPSAALLIIGVWRELFKSLGY